MPREPEPYASIEVEEVRIGTHRVEYEVYYCPGGYLISAVEPDVVLHSAKAVRQWATENHPGVPVTITGS